MAPPSEYSVIPDGELRCVWMDAGVVEYKLCDRRFQCETCPFDEVIRSRHGRVSTDGDDQLTAVASDRGTTNSGLSMKGMFDGKLSQFLDPFAQISLPDDRLYSSNHTWMKKAGAETCTVGIDHLAVHLFGDTKGIVLPQTPCEAHRDAPCAWVIHREGAIVLGVPFSATIINCNSALRETPSLLGRSPYDEGWIFSMHVKDLDEVASRLLTGRQAASLYREQGELLRREFLNAYENLSPTVGATLADGGSPLTGLPQILGEASYFEIISRLFRLRK